MDHWLTESLLTLDTCDFPEAPAIVPYTDHAGRSSEGKPLAEPCLPEPGSCPVYTYTYSVPRSDSTSSLTQTPAPYSPSPYAYRHPPTPGRVVPCCSPAPPATPSTPASIVYAAESPYPGTCDLTNDGLTSGAEEEVWPEDSFVWPNVEEDHQPIFSKETNHVTSLSISASFSSPAESPLAEFDVPAGRHTDFPSSACPQPSSDFGAAALSPAAELTGFGDRGPVDGWKTLEMETLDPQMARAYHMSRTTGSLMPLIKEELKYTIMARRHSAGQREIMVDFPAPGKTELSEEDKKRRQLRLETNRAAASRHRQKKKETKRQEEEEVRALEVRNKQLRAEVSCLERERATLRALLGLAPPPE